MEEDPYNLEEGDPAASLLFEANEIDKDVGSCVNIVAVSHQLPASAAGVFINVETKEGTRYCIELSTCGYRIIGNEFDTEDGGSYTEQPYYETIYMLLDSLSPLYRMSFASCLASKLEQVAVDRGQRTGSRNSSRKAPSERSASVTEDCLES